MTPRSHLVRTSTMPQPSPSRFPSAPAPSRLSATIVLAMLFALSACGKDAPIHHAADQGARTKTVIGTTTGSRVDFARPTRILLVGYSKGMGSQFVEVAASTALRHRVLGDEQIVLVASPEVGGGVSDRAALERFGVSVVFDDSATRMGSPWLLRYLSNFGALASLEFFGHSSTWGIGLQDGEPRLGTDTPRGSLDRLAGHFLPGAHVALTGCNSGAFLAPFLSEVWGVPVIAALTGTNFQRLHSNGQWYFNDPGLFPAGGWAKENRVSFASPVPCAKGGCLRMKPTDTPYAGYWGRYDGGLGYYKTFCAKNVAPEVCARGAARHLFSYPGTKALRVGIPWEDVRAAALDFLCPNPSDGARRSACFSALTAAASTGGSGTYTAFRGRTLACTVRGCDFEDGCRYDDAGLALPGTCSRTPAPNPKPREYVEEYRLLHWGAALLAGGTSPVPLPVFP